MRTTVQILLIALCVVAMGGVAWGQFNGTYNIGTGQTYPTLKAACDAINAGTVTGNVTFYITSDLTEAANVGLGVNTAGFSITFKPSADENRTITFTQLADNLSPTGHFVIGYLGTGLASAWSDANTIATSNVTIDGYADGGSTKRLIFTNTNASHTSARVIMVVGACVNTVIKNCIINNLTTHTGSAFCVGAVVRKGTAIEVGPIGLTIDNNTLTATGNSVAMGSRITNSGTLTTVKLTGFVFKNNIVTAQRRLLEINYTTGGDIYNNEFYTVQTGVPATVSYGVWTSTGVIGTINIYNNKFLQSTTQETGAFGHRVVSLASTATYNVYNNTFAGMDKTAASIAALNLTYLFYSGLSGKIYNNTFYLPALTNASSTGYYSCIQLSGNTAEIKNNVFISDEATHTNPYFISAVPTPATDYNNFYMRQSNVNHKVVGTSTTFAAYRAANPTKDVNSISADVSFVSSTDLHIDPSSSTSWNVNGRGIAIAAISDDIEGNARSTTVGVPTDIGADEFTPNGGVEPAAATMLGTFADGNTTDFSSAGRKIASIKWHGSTFPSTVTLKYYPGVPGPGIPGGAEADNIKSYWNIIADVTSGLNYDLAFFPTQAEMNSMLITSLKISKRNTGANWWGTISLSGSFPWATNGVATDPLDPQSTFSDFTLTNGAAPLPIQLASFTGTYVNNSVRLNWRTISEVNNYGFYLQKRGIGETAWGEVANSFVAGHGTTNEPQNYTFTDQSAVAGSWQYRLRQVDLDGSIHFTEPIQIDGVTGVGEVAPAQFALQQNYPNPFNPETNIKFSVEQTGRATLVLYNMLGQKVATLFDDVAEAGQYQTVRLNGSHLASGMYLYRLQSGKKSELKKLMLLK